MTYSIKIGGRDIALKWDRRSELAYHYRMSCIGGHPSKSQIAGEKTAISSLFKILWALLPSAEHIKYQTPEDLFVEVDHESETEAIYSAINNMFADNQNNVEKKSSTTKSHLQE